MSPFRQLIGLNHQSIEAKTVRLLVKLLAKGHHRVEVTVLVGEPRRAAAQLSSFDLTNLSVNQSPPSTVITLRHRR